MLALDSREGVWQLPTAVQPSSSGADVPTPTKEARTLRPSPQSAFPTCWRKRFCTGGTRLPLRGRGAGDGAQEKAVGVGVACFLVN